MGSVEILIVWENLDCNRILLKNHGSGGKLVVLTLHIFAVCFHIFFRNTEKTIKNVGAPKTFPFRQYTRPLSKIDSEICCQNTNDFERFFSNFWPPSSCPTSDPLNISRKILSMQNNTEKVFTKQRANC